MTTSTVLDRVAEGAEVLLNAALYTQESYAATHQLPRGELIARSKFGVWIYTESYKAKSYIVVSDELLSGMTPLKK